MIPRIRIRILPLLLAGIALVAVAASIPFRGDARPLSPKVATTDTETEVAVFALG